MDCTSTSSPGRPSLEQPSLMACRTARPLSTGISQPTGLVPAAAQFMASPATTATGLVWRTRRKTAASACIVQFPSAATRPTRRLPSRAHGTRERRMAATARMERGKGVSTFGHRTCSSSSSLFLRSSRTKVNVERILAFLLSSSLLNGESQWPSIRSLILHLHMIRPSQAPSSSSRPNRTRSPRMPVTILSFGRTFDWPVRPTVSNLPYRRSLRRHKRVANLPLCS